MQVAKDFGKFPHEVKALPASEYRYIRNLYEAEAKRQKKLELEAKARQGAENAKKKATNFRRRR